MNKELYEGTTMDNLVGRLPDLDIVYEFRDFVSELMDDLINDRSDFGDVEEFLYLVKDEVNLVDEKVRHSERGLSIWIEGRGYCEVCRMTDEVLIDWYVQLHKFDRGKLIPEFNRRGLPLPEAT